jgi:hypothetical protein
MHMHMHMLNNNKTLKPLSENPPSVLVPPPHRLAPPTGRWD